MGESRRYLMVLESDWDDLRAILRHRLEEAAYGALDQLRAKAHEVEVTDPTTPEQHDGGLD